MAKKTATGKASAKPASLPKPTAPAPVMSPRRAAAAARRNAAAPNARTRPAAGHPTGPRQAETAPTPARRPATVAPKATTRIKVQARKMGYYGDERRRVGDVFLVERAKFNPSWMVEVNPSAKLQRTTGKEELRRKHDEILQMKHADRIPIQTAEHEVEDTGDNPLDAD